MRQKKNGRWADCPAELAAESKDLIIDQLWKRGEVVFLTNYGKKFQVVFSRPHGFFDLVIANKREAMGFITLKDEGRGKYSIVNDTAVNSHPSFVNTPGHGIEVKKKYRKRGIGGVLINLAVRMIEKDRQAGKKSKRFMIVASDITNQGLGCYQKFGFAIKEGMSVNAAYYVCPAELPDLNILPVQASFFKRLCLRLKPKR
ncbi:MAG: GNAT family N-acetyltransferase [Deltaproteobacteria bacterium]|nr:GNAT family N-acetyltransferase [Deltaproteobacteria bacterium]